MSTPKHTPIQSSVIGSDLDAKLFRTYARLVMASWSHDFQYTDWLSQADLERMTGLDWSNIKRHTAELRRAGLIDWKTHGKNDRRFFIVQVRLEDGAKAQDCAPSSNSNIISSSTEREGTTTSEGANSRPGINVGSDSCMGDSRTGDSRTGDSRIAPTVIDTESYALLKGLGLGEPKRSQIADLPECTPLVIRAHAARMRADGLRFPADVALLAFRIENGWGAPEMCESCEGLDGEHAVSCPTQAGRRAREADEAARLDAWQVERDHQRKADEEAPEKDEPVIQCQHGAYTVYQIFQFVLGELQLQLTSATYNTWLGRAQAAGYDAVEGVFTIGVHNGYAKDWLENRMARMVERTLTGIIGIPTTAKFVVWNKEFKSRESEPETRPLAMRFA